MLISPWLLIGIGGFFGATFRYEISGLIQNSTFFEFFPKGTLIVNVLGSLLLGILFSLYQINQIDQNQFLLFGTGFCGAFTTFSTFALETLQLQQTQGILSSITNISFNVVFTLLGIVIGMLIGNFFLKYLLKI